MRTKILMSILMIGVVAVGAGAGTLAYFSDVEKSTGNTFTAGELDLQIDYEGYYNKQADGYPNAGNWSFTDLTSEKFFDFDDVKPGDFGEGTVSLHVFDNDAWVRLMVDNVVNDDRGCNDPEREAGDTTCTWLGGGELGDNLYLTVWMDMGTILGYDCPPDEPACAADPEEGDNKLNTLAERATAREGYANDTAIIGTWILCPVKSTASKTYYVGIAWCVGNMSIDSAGVITCDGSGVGNIIQSDRCTSDVTFGVVQYRNNINATGTGPISW